MCRANMAQTSWGNYMPLVARSQNRAHVESNTCRSLPLPAGTTGSFEPRRPHCSDSGSRRKSIPIRLAEPYRTEGD
jgi:hypothetical protein